MANNFGEFIRELRLSRNLSMAQVALKSGVEASTLSRWESGQYQPDLPKTKQINSVASAATECALEAVMEALHASQEDWERAIALIDAPRAVRQLRAEAEERREENEAMPGGDLLRAMRLRKGLRREQVAARLGVSLATISRWEKSQTAPAEDRLPVLFDLLGAHPQEQAALRARRLLLAPPLSATVASLDACEDRLHSLAKEVDSGQCELGDLRFLLEEAQLWRLALHSPAARRLYALAYTWHGLYLSRRGLIAEAGRYADYALDTVLNRLPPEPFWTQAVHLVGCREAHSNGKPETFGRAVELLKSWLEPLNGPEYRTALYRDMADYAARGNQIEAALRFIRQARTEAERTEKAYLIELADVIHARVLLDAGRAREALHRLPEDKPGCTHQRIWNAMLWAEVLNALGDKQNAHDWLQHGYDLMNAHDDYIHLKPLLDRQSEQV